MPNLNKVMLMGNLTRDPELRFLPSGMAVVSIGLAINRRWKNQQGEQQEEVSFIDCEGFAKTAENINQYMKKGKPLFIEGRLKLDQWQDKEGNNRSKLKVVIENFQFIDSRQGAGGPGPGGDQDSGYQDDGGGEPSRAPAAPRTQQYRQPPQAAGNAPPQGGNRPPARQAPANQQPPSGDPHQPVEEEDIPF